MNEDRTETGAQDYLHTDGALYRQYVGNFCDKCLGGSDRMGNNIGHGLCGLLHRHSHQDHCECKGPWILSPAQDTEVL